MRKVCKLNALATGLVLTVTLAGLLLAADAKPAPAAPDKPAGAGGAEITVKGLLLNEYCCTFKKENDQTLVFFAAEGPVEIQRAWDEIMKQCWPGDSMDADQAKKMQDMIDKRLKYYITPGVLQPKDGLHGNPAKVLTGVVSEKDGRKWLTVSKESNVAKLKYPDKMNMPDKPVQPCGRTLAVKVTDKLALNFILVPCGKFMMGDPFFCGPPRWQDEPPHLVTLTKPFYLAEIPVTQELYESVMTNNPSTVKDPQRPVRNVFCGDIYKFCQILSAKNGGRVFRLPTQAEWEWACRVGTSNPPFIEKFLDQESTGKARGELLPVKSKKPNAWGFYDMVCNGAYEITRDDYRFSTVEDAVDQWFKTDCSPGGQKHAHMGKGSLKHKLSNHEGVGTGNAKDDAAYGNTKFRLLVEATPEEIVALEKSAGK